MQDFIEVAIHATDEQQEVLVALLSAAGYDSFWQDGPVLKAYVLPAHYSVEALQLTCDNVGARIVATQNLPHQNWNEVWERHYPPVAVGDFCLIRSEFHQVPGNFRYTVVIQPKMSFGTGHHATTQMMVRQLEPLNLQGQTVLDMGCGTGVLGILARMMGASSALFIDIEDWAIDNTRENLARNGVAAGTDVRLGGAEQIGNETFHLILANINRNVLLADGARYVQALRPGGHIALSGFFDFDAPLVLAHYRGLGLTEIRTLEQENWYSILLQKP
jgi:ribosomal protein L11 methyltransferase